MPQPMSELDSLPKHIAIIMDGNGRWARKRQRPRIFGHRAGVTSVRAVVAECTKLDIQALTVFAFSSENWHRPKQEVGMLMELFLTALSDEADKLNNNSVRLRVIGDRSAFSEKLQRCIQKVEELTASNTGLTFNIAANYGGRWDIEQAALSMARDVCTGQISEDEINEAQLASRLSLADLPEPDLFIRTGGERRISNYLLWQLAYTELYFSDLLWPEFDEAAFHEALDWFADRERRFGKTSEQLESSAGA